MEIFGYLASILMGISLGMIGGGGSILTVPILVYFFSTDVVLATGYSLFIVGLTSLVGGVSYLKRGEVDLRTGFLFAVPSFIGVYLARAYVMPHLPDPVFSIQNISFSKSIFIMAVFSILMLAASISMIRPERAGGAPEHSMILTGPKRVLIISFEGLLVGAITGFVGAGGGFLIIPALVLLAKVPMRIAIGTSLFIIGVKSLIGFAGDLQHHVKVDWSLLLTMAGIAVVGLILGMKLATRVGERTLKVGFGYAVLLMGIFILFDQIKHLT